MKRAAIVILIGLVMAVALFSFAAEKGKLELKAGDERYVCNCGEKCPCNTISSNGGKCTCGNDMVKAKVTKAEKGKATFKADGWDKERSFKTVAKYACACEPGCKCDTISQNPGNCSCGKAMMKVAEAKK